MADTRRRLRAMLVVVLLVFGLFAGRLVQLQGIDASAYAATAQAERMTTVVLPATRGAILDRDGVPLATSLDARDITTDQTLVTDPAATASRLARVLGIATDVLVGRLSGTRKFAYVAREVTPAVARRVTAMGLQGIFTEKTSLRVYPNGELASNVIGYLRPDGTPGAGLESSLDSTLSGTAGKSTFEHDRLGRRIPTGIDVEVPPVAGEDVVLTIDRDLQWVAQQAIATRVAQANAASGTVVVMDVRTGKVLAMASAPSFDPNHPSKATPGSVGNRALTEIYEPGSTSKIMTAAAAIEEGVVTPASPVTVPPTLSLAGHTFHDSEPHPTEHLTFAGVLAKSSNIGTILTYRKIGPERLYSYLTKFGIGQPTGLNFPYESRGLLAQPKDWSGTQGYTIAFGQGLSLTAMQATSVFATIANDGVRVAPQLVAGTRDANGVFTPAPAPARTTVVSPASARAVRAMLEGVVSSEGTAPQDQIPGYRVAGKTGTAQRADPTCGCYRGYTASFIGIAPADVPRLAVSVTLQDPKGVHYGGMLGGPVFKDVMSFALKSLGVPPTGTAAPHLRLTFDR